MMLRRRSRQSTEHFGPIMRRHARTFTVAARFLDGERRHATEVLYAFFRTLDDLVDERPPDADLPQLHAELARWHELLSDLDRAIDHDVPLERALAEVVLAYGIPTAYLRALLHGLADDLDNRPILTFDDLERYSFRVAGSVGLAMCHVLGATTASALTAASALGIAMQITNIIRDIDGDLRRGRIYLPASEIAQFPGAEAALRQRLATDGLRELVRLQVVRARRYYAAGALGVPELPIRVRYPILVAIDLYAEILRVVEGRSLDVFAGRAVVGRRRKALLAGRAALRQLSCPADGASSAAQTLGPAAVAELERVGVPVSALLVSPDGRAALVEA